MFARVDLRIVGHALEELVENLTDARPRRNPKLLHHVVAVDQKILERERRGRADLLLHPLPERFERVHPRRSRAAPDVVSLAQREEGWDVLEPDLAHEAADRRWGPFALVPEHVIADEMRDASHGLLVEAPPAQDVPCGRLADELVLVEVAVGEGRRLADVVKSPASRSTRASGGGASSVA